MKFINLLKKELCELINKQMIASLAVILVMLMAIGSIMETTINEAVTEAYSVNLCDRDDTEFTGQLIDMLEDSNVKLRLIESEGDDYAEILDKNDIQCLIIIPEGFTEALTKNGTPGPLTSVSRMTSAAAMANISNDNSGGISAIEHCITTLLAAEAGITDAELILMDAPVAVTENTVVDEKSAVVSMSDIMNKVTMQNMILPLVVFVLIMMTSQSLMSSISNEKIDKTLETLLSAPVSRTAVISAKMLAAAVVALINAAVYMFGFSFFVSGSMEETAEEALSSVAPYISVEAALSQLGLSLGIADYLLIGVQLFLTIMICLAVSLILGAMVNDTKSSQTMIMPIMMLAMIPYFVSMLADVNALPTAARILIYAIPFTHTFSAMANLMFGNDILFFGGLAYQAVVFLICMFFALRLFKSDKIFTISLNLGQKSRYKKNKNSADNE